MSQPGTSSSAQSPLYEVEKVLGHHFTDSGLYLKVRWVGYTEEADSWEPEENIIEGAKEAVLAYYLSLSMEDRRPLAKYMTIKSVENIEKTEELREKLRQKQKRGPR